MRTVDLPGDNAGDGDGEQPFPSTTWEFKRVKVRRPPEATGTAAAEQRPSGRRRAREPRDPLGVVVRYRGGSECWWQIEARGRTYRFPGWVSIHDALARINAGR
jgi:hypothetical protein